MPSTTVQPIHFEDFSGHQFERLVFAYHVRAGWKELAWYGQTGSDQGRDIIGTEPLPTGERKTVIQCVNRPTLTQSKATEDMAKAKAADPVLASIKFVCGGNVSSARREAVAVAAKAVGINQVSVWSAAEFEEHLRLHAEPLLKRWVSGEVFPDAADDIIALAADYPTVTDADMLLTFRAVLDRPALQTPIHLESSLPNFLQAIEDTIGAMNTGLWRDREGNSIKRIASRHHVRDAYARMALEKLVHGLDDLRRQFKQGLNDGSIRHCTCGDVNCPTFMIEPAAARQLDMLRDTALSHFPR